MPPHGRRLPGTPHGLPMPADDVELPGACRAGDSPRRPLPRRVGKVRGTYRHPTPRQGKSLRACENMGTGTGPMCENHGKPGPGEAPVPVVSQSLSGPLSLKVLAVMTQRDLLAHLGRLLSALRYEFHAAASPDQAAAVLQATPPDFLVVDSEPSAAAVIPWCRSVCHHHRPRYFYTLLLVADPRPEELRHALEAGVDDFLHKPIRYVEVMVRLRAGARVLELERRLAEQSGLDPLTGLLNRRALEKEISTCLDGREHDAPPDTCVLADVDFLGAINTRFGRPAGDAAIRALGDRLRECLPPGGLLAHFGAGRFAALLPNAPEAEAARWAESARAGLEAESVPDADHDHPPDGPRPLTASFAIMEIAGQRGDAGRLVAQAMGLVQAAKQAGRNHVLRQPACRHLRRLARDRRRRQDVRRGRRPRRDDALHPPAPRRSESDPRRRPHASDRLVGDSRDCRRRHAGRRRHAWGASRGRRPLWNKFHSGHLFPSRRRGPRGRRHADRRGHAPRERDV